MKNINVLIQKANRIGQFFEAMPDRQEGIDGIADHIRKFWEPRMRAAMLQFLDEHPNGGTASAQLNSIVLEAISAHRKQLEPSEQAV